MLPARNKISSPYSRVWDERSQLIKLKDPSECIRSDEIIPILKSNFRDIDIRYYNGSLLYYALDQKFFEEYNANRKEGRALLDLLINIEKAMINMGELTSDNAHIIAKKHKK